MDRVLTAPFETPTTTSHCRTPPPIPHPLSQHDNSHLDGTGLTSSTALWLNPPCVTVVNGSAVAVTLSNPAVICRGDTAPERAALEAWRDGVANAATHPYLSQWVNGERAWQ